MVTSSSFLRWQTVNAAVKSNTGSGADFGAATLTGTTFSILPLMPTTPEILMLYAINSPRETFVTYTQGAPEMDQKDILTIDSVDYRVRGSGVWPTDNNFYEIILEQIDGT